jgi:hypothetical protein
VNGLPRFPGIFKIRFQHIPYFFSLAAGAPPFHR